ncbi:MAG: 50S ribosomal protein L22 [Patescibacteria group bacterium]
MEVRAQLNNVRLAPRKVRSVVNLLKKKDALAALNQLDHIVLRPTEALSKLIRSAIASAENTYSMVAENLYIKDFIINEGVKLKRYLPRAQGRATEIQKKTSRITLVLDERVVGLKRDKAEQKAKEEKEKKDKEQRALEAKKPGVERELGKEEKGERKRLFSRKAI